MTLKEEKIIARAHDSICKKKGNYQYAPNAKELQTEIDSWKIKENDSRKRT